MSELDKYIWEQMEFDFDNVLADLELEARIAACIN